MADLTLEEPLAAKVLSVGWEDSRHEISCIREKAEIIQLVEQSHLPAKRTLDKLGIPRATFYRWYDRYCEGGPGGAG